MSFERGFLVRIENWRDWRYAEFCIDKFTGPTFFYKAPQRGLVLWLLKYRN